MFSYVLLHVKSMPVCVQCITKQVLAVESQSELKKGKWQQEIWNLQQPDGLFFFPSGPFMNER